MKAYQREIREAEAQRFPRVIPADFSSASVLEITKTEAKSVLERYEWLARLDKRKALGATRYTFGLFFGDELAGIECFGATAGTNTNSSVCGLRYTNMVATVTRGCCVSWAHPHSASYLITKACKLMTQKGFHVFVAYADAAANEIGTVYQACGWVYCGPTNTGHLLRFPNGREVDARLVSGYARNRSNGDKLFFFPKPTRHEMRRN
jgi:hypothetical protein